MKVHAKAPARIDLAGGTLDLWPLYLLFPGALTVNIAITRYAHCLLEPGRGRSITLLNRDTGQRERFSSFAALERKRSYRLPLLAGLVSHFAPKRGLTLTTWSEAPAGAGLGGSSTLGVAIAAALSSLTRRRLTLRDSVALVRDIEVRVLGVPTGEQDHYPAAFGGVSAVHLDPIATWREPLGTADRDELGRRLLLVYTGKPRRSGINNWEVYKRLLDGDARLRRNFAKIASVSVAMREALAGNRWQRAARLLGEEWRIRKSNFSRISTPAIDRLIRAARREGAQGAKVCGAGGGGCVVFFVPPARKERIAAALAGLGAQVLPFCIAAGGVRVRRLP